MNDELITRTAVMKSLKAEYNRRGTGGGLKLAWIEKAVSDTPSAQPDIIRCRNCKFASGDSRICMKFGHSPIGELDSCAWAERRTDG